MDYENITPSAEVFTKPNCPHCIAAKALLTKRGVAVMEISAVDNREYLIERVTGITGNAPKTVPQIFLNGHYIGGHDQLVEHYAELDKKAADKAVEDDAE